MIEISLRAPEKGSYFLDIVVTDEEGDPVIPDSCSWSLRDGKGEVVNSRSAVAVSPLGSTFTIVLTGDDLGIGDGGRRRALTLEGTYTSVNHGAGLPLTGEIAFEVEDYVGIT